MQTFAWSSQKPTGHPAEKPTALMDFCLAHSTPGRVLDPFAGSGTSGVSALNGRRPFVGIEIDGEWAESARRRIADAAAQGNLFHDETAARGGGGE